MRPGQSDHSLVPPRARCFGAATLGGLLACTEFFGTPVSMDRYRQRPDDLARLLRETGFDIWTTVVREPGGDEKTAQGYLLARKPSAENA
jgi:hypothetical protein